MGAAPHDTALWPYLEWSRRANRDLMKQEHGRASVPTGVQQRVG